ncbi:hypothetical protein Back2_17710 [Nocardioides baekrokdamisoli]|uniref:Uncharacterized protein n=1 Tax=Nocardioides baekrokdamisoli TaxID=1804624 RepID=A0A3G9J204_9ACTN|nr:hypothetical protein [Nocardioides baekrokdamisoli]BBH17484.1 hypothetical protein Back2_17710 [Nocardioides baekrokdamisoli]
MSMWADDAEVCANCGLRVEKTGASPSGWSHYQGDESSWMGPRCFQRMTFAEGSGKRWTDRNKGDAEVCANCGRRVEKTGASPSGWSHYQGVESSWMGPRCFQRMTFAKGSGKRWIDRNSRDA